MTTPSTAVQVLIQTQKMSDPMTSYGMSLVFDFSTQIPAGQMILAYSVALSGFSVQYATQSGSSDELVQQFGIGLVPSLVGNQVVVACNILLADYDGDAASETQDVSGRESYAMVTVIAIVGTAPTNNWTVTNAFWLKSGTDTVSIPSYTTSMACSGEYIAGFDYLYANNAKNQINGFKLGTSSNSGDPTTSVILSGSITMSTDDKYSGGGTVGLGFLAFENPSAGQVLGVEIVTVQNQDITWSMDSKGSNGMTSLLAVNVDVPDGYKISQAAFLMSSISLDFKDYHDLAIIAAGQSSAVEINIGEVTVPLQMNLYSDEGISTYRIQTDSTLEGLLIAVLEPS